MKESAPYLNRDLKITLVGAGNLAWNLVQQWKNFSGIEISYWNRNPQNSTELSGIKKGNILNHPSETNNQTDFVFICSNDSSIEETARLFQNTKACLVHCSGSTGISLLKKINPNCAVFYPLQTFSKQIESNWNNIPVFIEAEKLNYEILSSLAEKMGARALPVNSEQRLSFHLAAVFACNFTNHLWSVAWEICNNHQLHFDLLRPLIQQTLDKAFLENNNPAKMQTGPAKRKDFEVIARHLSLLKQSQINHDIYELLTKAISQNPLDEKL